MTVTLYMLLSVLIGLGAATQVSMLASIGRDRGATESTWISLLSALVGIAVLMAIRAARGDVPVLPSPLDRIPVLAFMAIFAASLLILSMRGLDPYFAIVGLFGVAYLVGAALLVPEIGITRFIAGTTAGTVFGALGLDHFGTFGAEPQQITAFRIVGVVLLVLGVILVRGSR